MKIQRIYLPESLYYTRETLNLNGEVLNTENHVNTVFVIGGNRIIESLSATKRIIGQIGKPSDLSTKSIDIFDGFIQFEFGTERENHLKVHRIIGFARERIQIILYNPLDVRLLNFETEPSGLQSPTSEINELAYLKRLLVENHHPPDDKRILQTFHPVINAVLIQLSFISSIFHNTIAAKHIKLWKRCWNRSQYWTILFDVIIGISIVSALLNVENFGQYFMRTAEIVVERLRHVLESLRGNPIGLKLNGELNDFFLNCFIYHIDMWKMFLVIISPTIQYLIIPLTVIGCFGVSFQMAILSDLILLISIHAHCFYIYAAVLYHIEVVGLRTLWKVLLGRRKNILKSRVESFEYKNPQLYLATIFFATLLFLLPTVLTYYVVFATIRFAIYCIIYILSILKEKILSLPLNELVAWIFGKHFVEDNISITHLKEMDGRVVVHKLTLNPVFPWRGGIDQNIEVMDTVNDPETNLTIGQFFGGLVRGDLMGFIQPKKIKKE